MSSFWTGQDTQNITACRHLDSARAQVRQQLPLLVGTHKATETLPPKSVAPKNLPRRRIAAVAPTKRHTSKQKCISRKHIKAILRGPSHVKSKWTEEAAEEDEVVPQVKGKLFCELCRKLVNSRNQEGDCGKCHKFVCGLHEQPSFQNSHYDFDNVCHYCLEKGCLLCQEWYMAKVLSNEWRGQEKYVTFCQLECANRSLALCQKAENPVTMITYNQHMENLQVVRVQ